MTKLSSVDPNEDIKVLVYGDSGTGKCLGYDTPVIMFNGDIKAVQDIVVGETLMGPDSRPRTVKALGRGQDQMFQITPVKGTPWECNSEHVLTLYSANRARNPANDGVYDIALNEFVEKYPDMGGHKLIRTGVDFPCSGWDSPIKPYQAGVWLGDGHMRGPSVTKNDVEIERAWQDLANQFGMPFKVTIDGRTNCKTYHATRKGSGGHGPNPVQEALKTFKLNDIKHIPQWALTSSRADRLELLAGMLDTDGHMDNGGFEWSTKPAQLCEEFLFLARSLGFAAYSSPKVVNGVTYWRVWVSGDCSVIPTRIERKKASVRKQIKSVLRTGFEIEALGEGYYYGFTLDGDGRFLLGDFTVTHNTCFGTSFPTPLFVADFDNKIGSAASFYAGSDRLEQIDFETYFPKGAGVQAGAAVFNEWSTKLYELEKLAKEGKFPYKTIVLDSLTLYADRMLEKVMCDNPSVKRYAQGVAVLQDYGILNPNFKQQLGRVLALPCNVVVCAHIKVDKDDLTGQLVRGPNLSPKLAAYLPILFYEVYHSYAEKKGNETIYYAQTKSDYQYQCRSQIRGLASPIPLTYESLRQGNGEPARK